MTLAAIAQQRKNVFPIGALHGYGLQEVCTMLTQLVCLCCSCALCLCACMRVRVCVLLCARVFYFIKC